MKHFKNHNFFPASSYSVHPELDEGLIERNKGGVKPAFTLIETMLAMMIVGIVLTPIFMLFGTITQRMNRSMHQFYGILAGKQLLYEARQKQGPQAHEFSLEKRVEDSDIRVAYKLTPTVDAKSSLASLKDLHRELVTITWNNQGQERTEQMVAYVYKQSEQKKS